MAASSETLNLPPPPHSAPVSERSNPSPFSTDLALNDVDLLTEILLRLPAKSLIRFKSVCKKWLSLISSDHFCHQHTLRRPKPEPSLILETPMSPLYYFHPTLDGEKTVIPYSLNVPDHRILQACNGLMLLEAEHLEHSYYVYNPTTRRSRRIILNHSDKYSYIAGVILAFDPSESPYYRIICFRSDDDSGSDSDKPDIDLYKYQIEVYDSESHSWRLSLEEAMAYHRRVFHSWGVYCSNAIFWSIDESYCFFDIAKNVIRTLPRPPTPASEYPGVTIVMPRLQESNGRLYHYVCIAEGERESVAVWELGRDDDDDHSKWQWLFKYQHLIHPHPLTPSLGRKTFTNLLRLIAGSDGDGGCSLLISRDVKMRAYSFIDRSYKEVVDLTCKLVDYQPDDDEFYLIGLQFGEILALV